MSEDKSENKTGSWAPSDVHTPEDYENKEWAAQRQAALDSAMITIANMMVEMVAEQRRINDHIISGTPVSKVPNVPSAPRTTPTPTKISTPSKVDEDGIVGYYKEKISTVLEEDDVSKTLIRVQESDVYIKFPWLGKEKFGPVGGLMRELNAQYVSAGKDTHYLAPLL